MTPVCWAGNSGAKGAGLPTARAWEHKGRRKAAFTPMQLCMRSAAIATRDANAGELAKQ
jgi:hypothetical protein